MKRIITRIVIVAIVAAFPAICIGVGLPGMIATGQTGLGINQQPEVIDLSGPQVTRSCPNGMELKTLTDTRSNFNRNGIVTNVSYECIGPSGATVQPTETTEFTPSPMPNLAEQNFFFSPAADWLRWFAYPISFVLVLGLSLFVESEPDELPLHRSER